MLDGRGPLGCLAPTPQTIIGGTYPLARPLFVYVSRDSLKREVVRRFARFYLARATDLGKTASILAAPRFALSRSSSALERTIAELDNASS
jgi:phosphate transport system substrate-binding protein